MSDFDRSAQKNSDDFAKKIGASHNFDIIIKKCKVADRNAQFFMIDGFVKDEIMEKLLESLMKMKEDELPENSEDLAGKIPYVEVNVVNRREETATNLLMGMTCMFLDGYDVCFVIDCRTYPARSVAEPWKDRVMRGSRDGFVESIVSNVALIRRRIRTQDFRVEVMTAGTMSKTDIAIAYIRGKVDASLLHNIKNRISKISVEALTMNIESFAESMLEGAYINPFPKFKYTERPDSAAAAIYDGNIVILVDNSPSVIIIPVSIFDIVEEADDYYFPPITGTYIKISRYIITFISLILTPVWLLLLNNPQWIPDYVSFITIDEGGSTIPVFLQLIILEFAIDGLRLAAVNTPTMLSTPLSVVAGIVVGEYAVSSGWFDPETMLYMAFVSIGTYTQASFELGYALKFFRLIMLILTQIFGLVGLIIGFIWFIVSLAINKTLSGKSYIYPLIPFNGKMLLRKLFRLRLGKEK